MKKFLVTNIVQMTHAHHFSPSYAQNLQQNPKEYFNWKNDLTVPFTETNDVTVRNLRPNFETMKRCNQKLMNKRMCTE